MRFGLIANVNRSGAEEAIAAIIKWSRETGQELILNHGLKELVTDYNKFAPREDLAEAVDVLVAMGGDGSILAAARSVGSIGTPLLGINIGSLGFLTQQTPKQMGAALDAILAGKYRIEDRIMLKAEIGGRDPLPMPFALNDIVLDNGSVSRVLNINLKINGEKVVSYIADGLIISTPTGSTAYNLAVGGPIMNPTMDAMIAAPIAPFSLTTRPMILPGSDRLELDISTPDREAVLTLDGQVRIELHESEPVTITKADYTSKFIVFPENSYYKLLRNKLHWGMPPNF
ncbi:MAG: NAD(+)/NADH kinase [bacterium]|nr:NAD(+)/NADH kinase [bacterium]